MSTAVYGWPSIVPGSRLVEISMDASDRYRTSEEGKYDHEPCMMDKPRVFAIPAPREVGSDLMCLCRREFWTKDSSIYFIYTPLCKDEAYYLLSGPTPINVVTNHSPDGTNLLRATDTGSIIGVTQHLGTVPNQVLTGNTKYEHIVPSSNNKLTDANISDCSALYHSDSAIRIDNDVHRRMTQKYVTISSKEHPLLPKIDSVFSLANDRDMDTRNPCKSPKVMQNSSENEEGSIGPESECSMCARFSKSSYFKEDTIAHDIRSTVKSFDNDMNCSRPPSTNRYEGEYRSGVEVSSMNAEGFSALGQLKTSMTGETNCDDVVTTSSTPTDKVFQTTMVPTNINSDSSSIGLPFDTTKVTPLTPTTPTPESGSFKTIVTPTNIVNEHGNTFDIGLPTERYLETTMTTASIIANDSTSRTRVSTDNDMEYRSTSVVRHDTNTSLTIGTSIDENLECRSLQTAIESTSTIGNITSDNQSIGLSMDSDMAARAYEATTTTSIVDDNGVASSIEVSIDSNMESNEFETPLTPTSIFNEEDDEYSKCRVSIETRSALTTVPQTRMSATSSIPNSDDPTSIMVSNDNSLKSMALETTMAPTSNINDHSSSIGASGDTNHMEWDDVEPWMHKDGDVPVNMVKEQTTTVEEELPNKDCTILVLERKNAIKEPHIPTREPVISVKHAITQRTLPMIEERTSAHQEYAYTSKSHQSTFPSQERPVDDVRGAKSELPNGKESGRIKIKLRWNKRWEIERTCCVIDSCNMNKTGVKEIQMDLNPPPGPKKSNILEYSNEEGVHSVYLSHMTSEDLTIFKPKYTAYGSQCIVTMKRKIPRILIRKLKDDYLRQIKMQTVHY